MAQQQDESNSNANDQQDRAQVTVEIGGDGYETDIWAGSHTMRADEPRSAGGMDTGPNPYDFLLASLGSCTAMTIRMYADRKGWPLRSVNVALDHKRVHARDCEDCESQSGQITRITRIIDVQGDLSDEQRDKLLEIADKCPVHRTLTSEIRIDTEAAARAEA